MSFKKSIAADLRRIRQCLQDAEKRIADSSPDEMDRADADEALLLLSGMRARIAFKVLELESEQKPIRRVTVNG